jgi:hypothetical protein
MTKKNRMKQSVNYFVLIFALLVGVYFLTKDQNYPNSFEVTDISSKILSDRKQDFAGATLVNLDNDPEQEIFIAGHGTSNLLLKRSKDKFYPLEIPELYDSNGFTFAVTACDLDQDGRDEILILNHTDPLNNKSHSRIVKYVEGKWKDLLTTEDLMTQSLNAGYSASCIDRKGDGKYGFAVTSENGKLLYLESSGEKILDIAGEIGLALESKGRSVLGIPGPTGRTNIYVGNEDGPNFYFENDGQGLFNEKAAQVGLLDANFDARGMSLIDINHDDIPDLVFGNGLGPTRLLEQSRDGKFKDVTPEIMKDAYAVNSIVVADFNLDGYEDIYMNNVRGHNNLFARHKKNWHELDVPVLSEKDMFGVSTISGDLDKNGSFEILNTHGDGTHFPITLYSIKAAGKWIKFTVTLGNGGIPRGAVIKMRTSLRDQVRVISPGSGRFANYDNEMIFGLLKDENVLTVEVTLPSGGKFNYPGNYKIMKNNTINLKI